MSVHPPLPLLISGVAGVPGHHALRYFQAKYPGRVFGIRQEDNLLPPGRACSCATPRIGGPWPGCFTSTASPPCWIAPATAP